MILFSVSVLICLLFSDIIYFCYGFIDLYSIVSSTVKCLLPVPSQPTTQFFIVYKSRKTGYNLESVQQFYHSNCCYIGNQSIHNMSRKEVENAASSSLFIALFMKKNKAIIKVSLVGNTRFKLCENKKIMQVVFFSLQLYRLLWYRALGLDEIAR